MGAHLGSCYSTQYLWEIMGELHSTHLPDNVTNYNFYQVSIFCGLTQQNRPKSIRLSEPQNDDPLYEKLTLEDAAPLATSNKLKTLYTCIQHIYYN